MTLRVVAQLTNQGSRRLTTTLLSERIHCPGEVPARAHHVQPGGSPGADSVSFLNSRGRRGLHPSRLIFSRDPAPGCFARGVEDGVVRLVADRYVVPGIEMIATTALRVEMVGVSGPRLVRRRISKTYDRHPFTVTRDVELLIDEAVDGPHEIAHLLCHGGVLLFHALTQSTAKNGDDTHPTSISNFRYVRTTTPT